MSLPMKPSIHQHPTCAELKRQLSRFAKNLKEIQTTNFDQLYWFAEAVEQSTTLAAPDWAICQFGDLEILIKRQHSNYRIKQVQGYRNPESMFDAEGYLKEHYQEILPLSKEMEETLSAFL